MKQYPPEITEAIRCLKEGQATRARQLLSDYLCNQEDAINALLWLAKTSDSAEEALSAAKLVYSINPSNEIAQRAVAAVTQRFAQGDKQEVDLDLLSLTGLTEAQARSVIWPFKGLNRPVGVLLDEKKITASDLAWAAENAYDAYLQNAARTILLYRLLKENRKEQPKPVRYIEGRENLEYQERMASLRAGVYIGLILAVGIIVLVFGLSNRYTHLIDPGGLAIIELLVVPFSILIYVFGIRETNAMIAFKTGRQGERRAIDTLRAILRSPWVMVHNLEWPNRKWGDADLILIGPGGVWSLEVKNYTSKVRNLGDIWQYKSRFGWGSLSHHPGKQARKTAATIKDFLGKQDIPVKWVNPVVIWAGEEENLTVEDPAVPVWKLSEMEDQLEELWRKQALSEEQTQRAAALFEELVRKTKEERK